MHRDSLPSCSQELLSASNRSTQGDTSSKLGQAKASERWATAKRSRRKRLQLLPAACAAAALTALVFPQTATAYHFHASGCHQGPQRGRDDHIKGFAWQGSAAGRGGWLACRGGANWRRRRPFFMQGGVHSALGLREGGEGGPNGDADDVASGAGGSKSIASRTADGAVGGTVPFLLVEEDGPIRARLTWDNDSGRFANVKLPADAGSGARLQGWLGGAKAFLRHSFIPDDVTPDYFRFTGWRVFQRFVAATVSVFGTQALLLALGIKARRLGAAAAITWVLKDALGKCGRILWASKMGRRFDSDAKRWRFRSSLLYATANGLEIVTYIFPASFLILAAAANSLKQVSMLTSSATRNTIYRSFARGENIGDITAKGEAQIAVVDLLGMLSGVAITRAVGTSRLSIGCAYVVLSCVDIFAIYNEIRSVVFTILNYERTDMLITEFLASGAGDCGGRRGAAAASAAAAAAAAEARPARVAKRENVFRPARISVDIFTTVSGAGLTLPQLRALRDAFGRNRYLLTYSLARGAGIVLHKAADGRDTVKALLALAYLQRRLAAAGAPVRGKGARWRQRQRQQEHHKGIGASGIDGGAAVSGSGGSNAGAGGSGDGGSLEDWPQRLALLSAAQAEADANVDALFAALVAWGWQVDKFMFANIKRKVTFIGE
ncbi:unnamed protein product [Phaeothamnion confervicola]